MRQSRFPCDVLLGCFLKPTFTYRAISSESLLTSATIRANTVYTVSIFTAWIGIRGALVDICYKIEN